MAARQASERLVRARVDLAARGLGVWAGRDHTKRCRPFNASRVSGVWLRLIPKMPLVFAHRAGRLVFCLVDLDIASLCKPFANGRVSTGLDKMAWRGVEGRGETPSKSGFR